MILHVYVCGQLRGQFNEELEEIKREFMIERELILQQHEKEISDLKNIIFAMQVGRGREREGDRKKSVIDNPTFFTY
jgi:hypothetical protein